MPEVMVKSCTPTETLMLTVLVVLPLAPVTATVPLTGVWEPEVIVRFAVPEVVMVELS